MKENMLKKSFLIVLIQAAGMIISLLSVYFVAGDMGPVIYSLIGIRQVILGIVNTFSHLGIETVMSREALYWMHQGDNEKVQEYATQSILSRCMGFALLLPLLLGYLCFISYTKYDGQYLLLFLLFYVGACVGALNQSMSLIIRSRGGYVFSQLVSTLNGDIISVAAIIIYVFVGLKVYLLFIALGTIPVMFVYYSYIRQLFKRKYLQPKATIKKIKGSRYLWEKSWLDYFRVEADVTLISILFPPAIIGTYSIYKKFEGILKAFIEGFFDVLCQRQVQYKGDKDNLVKQEKKINLVRWGAIGVVAVSGIVFSITPNFFIELINLQKYDGISMIIYVVLLTGILHLWGKYEINAVSYFAPTKTIFKLGVAVFAITIMSYVTLIISPTIEGALAQRIVIWGATSLVTIIIFRRRRDLYYSNIYK